MIEVGQKIPSLTIKRGVAGGNPVDVDVASLFAGKKVVVFALPGAFTPTCSQKHLPGFMAHSADLAAKGVGLVACLSVNDGFVMGAWAKDQGVGDEIVMLADGGAALTKALGIDFEIPGMGTRARRGVLVFDDGVLTSVDMEAPGKFEVSSAEACLVKLG